MVNRDRLPSCGLRDALGRRALTCLLGLLVMAALTAPASAWADNTDLMAIAPPAGAYLHDEFAIPIFPTRALTFTIAYDDTYYEGDSIQCQLETSVTAPGTTYPTVTDGPWGSCGAVATSPCPKSACYSYSPAVGRDAQYAIFTRLVDTDGDQEGGAGQAEYDFQVDTTPPQTKLNLSSVNGQSPQGDGHHASFTFSTDDPHGRFECTLSQTATPGPWKACSSGKNIPFQIPVSTKMVHFSVRAVDPLGRVDPSPPTYAFSAIPCRARLLTRARTLAELARTGMRVRITCVTPSAWHFFIEPTTTLARRLEIHELGGFTGLFRRAGQSRTITVKAFSLHDLPAQFASQPLPVAYVTAPDTEDYEDFGAPQRITGRLSPGS
jgi:hypothetical protein